MTPAARATICASPCASAPTVARVVTSPAPASSASASLTARSITSRDSGRFIVHLLGVQVFGCSGARDRQWTRLLPTLPDPERLTSPQDRIVDQPRAAGEGGQRDERRPIQRPERA